MLARLKKFGHKISHRLRQQKPEEKLDDKMFHTYVGLCRAEGIVHD